MKIAISVMLALAAFLALCGGGCLTKEKVVDVVVTGETCVEWTEDHDSPMYTTPALIDYSNEIDQILQDNDLDRSDIKRAVVESASYTVTSFTQATDWVVSGQITVARNDVTAGPATLLEYTGQSIPAALGVTIPATLNSAGVEILNQALYDYIHSGAHPVMTFTVVSGGVTPAPTPSSRMIFGWKGCIKLQVVVEESVELPELF